MTIDSRLMKQFIPPIAHYDTALPNIGYRWRAATIPTTNFAYWYPMVGSRTGTPPLTHVDEDGIPHKTDGGGYGAVRFQLDVLSMFDDSGNPAAMPTSTRAFMVVGRIGADAVLGEGETYLGLSDLTQPSPDPRAALIAWDFNGKIRFNTPGVDPLNTARTYQPGDPFCAIAVIDNTGTPQLVVNGEHVAGTSVANILTYDRISVGNGMRARLTGAVYEIAAGTTAISVESMQRVWDNVRKFYDFL